MNEKKKEDCAMPEGTNTTQEKTKRTEKQKRRIKKEMWKVEERIGIGSCLKKGKGLARFQMGRPNPA